MADELELPGGLKTTKNVPADSWRGPYASIADASLKVPVVMRARRTVEIMESGIPVEYLWSENDTTEAGLKKKTSAGGVRIEPYITGSWKVKDIAISGQGFYTPKADIANSTVAPTGTGGQYWDLVYSAPSQSVFDLLSADVAGIKTLIGNEAGDADALINTVREVLAFLQSMAEGADLATLLNAKLDKSSLTDILGSSKTLAASQFSVNFAIAADRTRLDSAEGRLTTAEGKITTVEGRVGINAEIPPLEFRLSEFYSPSGALPIKGVVASITVEAWQNIDASGSPVLANYGFQYKLENELNWVDIPAGAGAVATLTGVLVTTSTTRKLWLRVTNVTDTKPTSLLLYIKRY